MSDEHSTPRVRVLVTDQAGQSEVAWLRAGDKCTAEVEIRSGFTRQRFTYSVHILDVEVPDAKP